MKKVLLLTDRLKYSCGVTTYLFNLMSYADREKVKFYLLAAPGDREYDFKKINSNIYLHERFAYENRNLRIYVLNIIKIFIYCKKNQIDIIHSQNYYVANIANIVKKLLKLKTIQTKHNIYHKGKLHQFIADRIIVVNKDMVKIATTKFNIHPKKIYEIPNGIKRKKNYSKIKSNNLIRIVVLSRLIYEKGIDIFIEAVYKIKNKIKKKCEFIIAGDGPYKKELELLNRKLNTKIRFIGTITDIEKFFDTSHIFVMPSRWTMEGFPYTIIEAIISYNLVITSNFRGLNSYFVHNQDGFVFEIDNVNALAFYLIEAINNYKDYSDKINICNKKFQKIFAMNKMIEKTISLYHEI